MLTNLAFASKSGDGVAFLARFIPALIGLSLIAGITIFFIMFIMGGVAWISSNGDKQALEGAKNKVSNAVIGVVILLSLYAITTFTGKFFKVDLYKITISSLFGPAGGSTGTVPGGGTPGGTGNAACSGCITGGCGITGQVYLGAGTTHYTCTATGWQSTTNPITSQTCGTCN